MFYKIYFIAGVSCVGKTTLGKAVGKILDFDFYDLDLELEKFYNMHISYLQEEYQDYELGDKYVIVLEHIVKNITNHTIISLPPRGLKSPILKVVKDSKNSRVILLQDRAKNIVERIVFYDDFSKKLDITLDEQEKKKYLRSIKSQQRYYYNSHYRNSDVRVKIYGMGIKEATLELLKTIQVLHN